MRIQKLKAREILDSRGNPTIEVLLFLSRGGFVTASVPSGASVGKREALEKRDSERDRYNGKGVWGNIKLIEQDINSLLAGQKPDLDICDKLLLDFAGDRQKTEHGANTIIGVSMALARAAARAENIQLYKYFSEYTGRKIKMPLCFANIINGGAHADNKLSLQEFMIIPKRGYTMGVQVHTISLVYQSLKRLLISKKLHTGVGDEGGFAPVIESSGTEQIEQVCELLIEGIKRAGYTAGEQVFLGLDCAASEIYRDNNYNLGPFGEFLEKPEYLFSHEKLTSFYTGLAQKYPLISIEDGWDEEDYSGWECGTKKLGEEVLLIGDDIFVTRDDLIASGVENNRANSVLIKPNQIGTVTETLQAIHTAHKNKYQTVISHRSGETNDTFISDLAVGVGSYGIKLGAPCRGERVAKYNRLLEIESLLRL